MTMMPNLDPQLMRLIASAMSQNLPADRMQSFPPGKELEDYALRHYRPPAPPELWGMEDWVVDNPDRLDDAKALYPEQFPVAEIPLEGGDLTALLKLTKALGRSHPAVAAAKKWFHGGEQGLRAQDIDPFRGDHKALFGHGFYTSDEPKIARGYEKARSTKGGWKRPGAPDATTYEMELAPEKILDLEEPIPSNVAEVLRRRSSFVYGDDDGLVAIKVGRAIAEEGATTESVFKAYRKGLQDASNYNQVPESEYVEDFQDLVIELREIGYDALTHTGGKLTGNDPHQVMIMLDPNDAYSQTGRGNQISNMKPTAHE